MVENLKQTNFSGPARPALGLMLFVLACFAAAGLGSLVTTPQIDGQYATLDKPFFNPPSWLFGPVWIILFLAMAVAGWLVWRSHCSAVSSF